MLSIGIDLGGTNIVASVVNEKYEILGTGKLPTATPRSADEIFDDIAQACKNAMAEAVVEISDISSVGMGLFLIIFYNYANKFDKINERKKRQAERLKSLVEEDEKAVSKLETAEEVK